VTRFLAFALLLDSGHTIRFGAQSIDEARARLAEHNRTSREAKARGEIVWPRLAVGLVCPKPKSRAARYMGQKGGHARAAALSPERRSEIARKAARTRWVDRFA